MHTLVLRERIAKKQVLLQPVFYWPGEKENLPTLIESCLVA
jgi:hypothetical protein